MGFGCHLTHVLQPILDKAQSEAAVYNRPTKKTLLELAETLVNCSYRPSIVIPYYSDEEREAAKQLLKINGLGYLTNCSPAHRAKTLILIAAEKQNLADLEAEQLSQSQIQGESSKLESLSQIEKDAEGFTSEGLRQATQNILANISDLEVH